MPRRTVVWVILTELLLGLSTAGAGIYDPNDRDKTLAPLRQGQDLPFEIFRDALSDSVQAADARNNERPARKRLIERRTALRKDGLDRLTNGQLGELGVLHLRLREIPAAIEVLKRAEGRNPRDNWTLTTLGTLQQVSGELNEAARYLEAAKDFAPTSAWVETVGYQPAWIKTLERSQLKLLRLRLREGGGRAARGPGGPMAVDELFPVRFVGESGDFEPGKMADAEKAKLPADAVAIVQQLLLWLPEDTRLYWLLGELYNARGDLSSADAIFEECVWSRRFDTPALREHRRLVKEAIANQVPPTPPPPPDWRPSNGQLIAVGVISGGVLLALAYFQMRQLFRGRP